MSTTVTHICGHTIEHEQNYNDEFADRLSRRPCGDCFRAQYNASVEAAKRASADLPALTGSEKQVAWATKIRAEILDRIPGLRPLLKYVRESRVWIDWREPSWQSRIMRHASTVAFEAEDFAALVEAAALEVNYGMRKAIENDVWQRRIRVDPVDAMQTLLDHAIEIMLAVGTKAACTVVVEISADRDRFLTVAMTAADGDDARAGVELAKIAHLREPLALAIDAQAKDADDLLAQRRAEAAEKKRIAESAAKAAAEEKARAEARAKAAAEALAKRMEPYRAALAPLSWDASDGYWTARRNKHIKLVPLATLEAHSRAVEALRVLSALPNRDAVKAIENVHPDKLLDTALDAQALAEVVGANSARAMHVAAGLPKPTIKRTKSA